MININTNSYSDNIDKVNSPSYEYEVILNKESCSNLFFKIRENRNY
jgi:hypothetical protein